MEKKVSPEIAALTESIYTVSELRRIQIPTAFAILSKKVNAPYLNRKLDYTKHGFDINIRFYQVDNFSFLVNSFIIIFQSANYLKREDTQENIATLTKLFSGENLGSVKHIKWYSQVPGDYAIWKQLFFIFYNLYTAEIIKIKEQPHDFKKSIGYRLINAFKLGNGEPVSSYSSIDVAIGHLFDKAEKLPNGLYRNVKCPKKPLSLKENVDILIGSLEKIGTSYLGI